MTTGQKEDFEFMKDVKPSLFLKHYFLWIGNT